MRPRMNIPLYSFLSLYVLVAAAVVFILFRNSGASDSLQNVSILFAGLIPAVIAVVPYLSSSKQSEEFSYYLFFDEPTGSAISFPLSPYESAYFGAFANLDAQYFSINADGRGGGEEQDKWLAETKNLGFDLLERMILQNLVMHFGMHWDLTFSKRITPIGQSQSGRSNSGIVGTRIPLRSIQNAFPHNPLISNIMTTIEGAGLTVPPGGSFSASQIDPGRFEQRIITIDSPGATMNITIAWSSGGEVPSPFMGVQLPNPAWSYGYSVNVDVAYHKNDVARTAHEDWFNGVTHVLSEADWGNVEAAVENKRRAQLLGLK